MAVPASGTANLSMRGIKDELENNNYAGSATFSNISLQDMSDGSDQDINNSNAEANRPDEDAPHAMSEFYSYDHDLAALSAPSGLAVTQQTTSRITFGYTEGNQTTKTHVELVNYNGSTTHAGDIINEENFDGSFPTKYQTVDGSGTSTFEIGSTNDVILGSGTPQGLTFTANDYIIIKIRGQGSDGTYTSYTGNATGYTLPEDPTGLSLNAYSTANGGYGDGNDGAYTVDTAWSAPSPGGASSYHLTHGPNSSRTGAGNTQDVNVSSGTSLSITGVNNQQTYYVWVKAIGGGGDSSDYIGTSVAIFKTYYYNTIADLTLSGTESSGVTQLVNSAALQFNIGNRETVALTCTSTAPAGGTLKYSISGTGDPGTSGNDNSATGFITNGSTATLANGTFNGAVIYVRFQYATASSSGTYNRTVTFTHNGVNDTVLVNCVTTAPPPGPPGPPGKKGGP